ncbi:hypothetical protein [Nonomuraea sp. NPDC049607]|uniref:hypothetical protein n=1 Tax=unclassified Nonomuraea TaxID=2593643 RepID=UPI00341C2F07
MNVEAQILEVLLRVQALETSSRTVDDITVISIVLMMTELAALQDELRQDFAAVVDELTALRRHINDHFNGPRCEFLRRPGTWQRPESN